MPPGQPANTMHKQEDTSWAHVLFLLLLSPTFQEFEIPPAPHDLKYHQGTLLLISRVSGIHSPFLTITSPSATILGTTGDIPHQSSCPLFCSLHLPKHRSYEPPTSALKLSKPPLYDRKMSGLCSLASEAFHSWALVSDNPLFPKHPEETWTQMNGCPGQTLRPMRLHISQPISCHLVGITRMRWCLTSPSPPL